MFSIGVREYLTVCIFVTPSAHRRQFRSVLRAKQDPVRDLGHTGGAFAHERRPANHKARVQGDTAEQEDNRSGPRPARHPGQKDIQSKWSPLSLSYFLSQNFIGVH